MERKITNYEAITSLLMISIANIVLTSGKILIQSIKSASILNCVFISFLVLLLTLIICNYLKKFVGKNLIDISELLGGKFLKITIGFAYVFYFILRYALFLKKMGDAMQIIYYPLTHIIFIIALLTISSGIIVSFGNNSALKSTSILVPFIYFTIILIFIGNSKNFNFSNIFPLLGYGWYNTFFTGANNIFVFNGLVYLFFIPKKLQKPDNIKKIGIIFFILNAIYTIFFIANIILLFSDAINHSELPPLYTSVRYIEFGSFFQRLDAVFIFICILGLICSLTINLTITLDILKDITNISDKKPLIYPCLLISFAIALNLKQNTIIDLFENQISKTLYIIFVIILPLLIFILANRKYKKKQIYDRRFFN